MVGDDRRDVVAAHAAGARAIAVGWGYHKDDDPPENWQADGLAETPGDLIEVLQSLDP